eukprot:g47494.t1
MSVHLSVPLLGEGNSLRPRSSRSIRKTLLVAGAALVASARFFASKIGIFHAGNAAGKTTFVPKAGLDQVLVQPGLPSGLQLLPLDLVIQPSCLFIYGPLLSVFKITQQGPIVKGFGKDKGSTSESTYGRLYGAWHPNSKSLAIPTGDEKDTTEGIVMCWDELEFKAKLRRADKVFHVNSKEPTTGVVRREVVGVVREDGSTMRAHFHYQLEANDPMESNPSAAQLQDDPRYRRMMIRADVANYVEEMKKHSHWPDGVDVETCLEQLGEAFEAERSNLLEVMAVAEANEVAELFREYTYSQLPDRLGMVDPDEERDTPRIKWWAQAPTGNILERPRTKARARNVTCHDFTTTVHTKHVLALGTVHVAIGFVDLGLLQHAHLTPATEKTSEDEPLRWIGYEANAFNVAKTLVIARMLKQAGAGPKPVLQVWYSSTWDADTMRAFRDALTYILEKKPPQDKEVLEWLEHWNTHRDVTLQTARQGWLAGFRPHNQKIGCWKKKADRLALAQYVLTGELAGGGPYGSVTMFSVPSRLHVQRPPMQNALATLRFDELIKLHMHMAKMRKQKTGEEWNVISSATAMLLHGMQQLLENVQNKKIVIEGVHHAKVTPDSPLLKEIAALNPWTVSWSDIVDGVSAKDFHKMAHALGRKGGEDTLHFGYSLKWLTEVKGAALIDYQDPRVRQPCLDAGRQLTADTYELMRAEDYLLLPPTGGPLVVAGIALEYAYFMHWAKWFLAQGNVELEQAVVMPSAANPLHTGLTVLSLTWTYDKKIKLQDVAGTVPDPDYAEGK